MRKEKTDRESEILFPSTLHSFMIHINSMSGWCLNAFSNQMWTCFVTKECLA